MCDREESLEWTAPGYIDKDNIWVYQCTHCQEFFKGELILEHSCEEHWKSLMEG